MFLLHPSLALASPVFLSEDPAAVELATAAWKGATACAGREASAAEEVTIEIGDPGGGFAGRAFVEGPRRRVWTDHEGTIVREETIEGVGLVRIRVDAPTSRNLAHEIAHAWVHRGPPALVEGATNLLAACIARRAPRRFPAERDAASLTDLEDLRTWANTDEGATTRAAGYAASRRMFALLAEATPERDLWRSDWTWAQFDAVLLGAGPIGAQIADALAGGVSAQRSAFEDQDEDGIHGIRERLAGTDPDQWDTDADGWWDGAPDQIREHAVHLGGDGSPVCSGWAAGAAGALITVRGGTHRRGDALPRVLVDGGSVDQSLPIAVAPGGSIALRAPSKDDGWGWVEGAGLVRDRRCQTDARWTVVAARGSDEALDPFVSALGRADEAADRVLGPRRGRLVAFIGDPPPALTPLKLVRVPGGWLDRGAASGWDFVAAYAVAAGRLSDAQMTSEIVGEPALYEALARALVSAIPDVLLAALEEDEVVAWTETAAACPGGWRGLAAGECGPSMLLP